MTDPILIVDVQRGFLNEFTHHVPQRLRRLLEQGAHDPVLFTRFVNVKGGPYPTFLGWEAMVTAPDTDLAPGLEPFAARGRVFEKRGVCGLPQALDAYLKGERPKRVYVAGIDTDMCVLKIAMDLFDRSIEPVVLTDCCASTAGLQAHLAGLAVLEPQHRGGAPEGRGPERRHDGGAAARGRGSAARPPGGTAGPPSARRAAAGFRPGRPARRRTWRG